MAGIVKTLFEKLTGATIAPEEAIVDPRAAYERQRAEMLRRTEMMGLERQDSSRIAGEFTKVHGNMRATVRPGQYINTETTRQ